MDPWDSTKVTSKKVNFFTLNYNQKIAWIACNSCKDESLTMQKEPRLKLQLGMIKIALKDWKEKE